jgi:hypothetical protein
MSLALDMEDVAQLAERRPVEANVAGSFPVILPKKSLLLEALFYFEINATTPKMMMTAPEIRLIHAMRVAVRRSRIKPTPIKNFAQEKFPVFSHIPVCL